MPESKIKKKIPRAKSYASIYDMFGIISYNNVHRIGLNKGHHRQSELHATYGDSQCTNYVTSEKYHLLHKESSCRTVIPSTSTIFYDLDDIAKRHSFHCLTEISISNTNFVKVKDVPINSNVFGVKSTAIVQECATQIHPKLLPRDSIELNTKKVKKKISRDAVLSSEIFLRDNDYLQDSRNHNFYKDTKDRQQKFWSYAKYRTEYTKPIPEEKRSKRKDKGKRTEDPCPCQLFSYACPCTEKKSLTELAKNSKSLTVADEVTSTNIDTTDEKKDSRIKTKKQKHDSVREDKPTNTSVAQMVEVIVPINEPVMNVPDKQDVLNNCDKNNVIRNKKTRYRKKSKRVLCPNCKEKVDVVISTSTTEEDENSLLKYQHSSVYRSKEIPSTTAYSCRASPNSHRSKAISESADLCLHEPRCELLPVCQILPENYYNTNLKCVKKHSVQKSTPRIIRITKACRHHPPCTVVPSCQRANVLKNNCEYIPPCLHRPRCVNLPLCVPFSKSLHYEETSSKLTDEVDTCECPHIPKCKLIPVCQHDSISNAIEHQINMVSRVQDACGFLKGYNTSTFLLNPKSQCVANSISPCHFNPSPCHNEHVMCRSNKSCQFNCSQSKCNETKDYASNDTVIFIRDVGCQFRNKSPKNCLQSKISSNSFDFVDVKMGNYCQNIHTLRYEDKSTNPLSGEDNSFSTVSMTSVDQDSECPSHGRRPNRCSPRCSPRTRQTSGFIPKSAYVTAYSTLEKPGSLQLVKSEHRGPHNAFPVKSRRSFLKGKYTKMFSVKRKKRSKISNYVLINSSSRKALFDQNK